jgi:alpha 1,2-mannosyltransferase
MIQWSPKDDSQFFGFRKQTENSTATVKPAFLHANTPKMNAGHLVDEGDLVDPASGLHMRLWGDSENQVQLFGFDLEKATWLKVVETGCELSGVIREWKERDDICGRAKNHFTLTFGSDPSDIDV